MSTFRVKPMNSGSWVNAIRNPSLRIGGMKRIKHPDGSETIFIPNIHQNYNSGDAYPADYKLIEA